MPKPRLLLVPQFTELEWAIRDDVAEWAEVASFDVPAVGDEPITQEQVAENVKRLRADYCFTGLGDNLHRFVPRPVGPRVAHVRVAEPIEVEGGNSPDALLAELRQRMQRTLDEMAAGLPMPASERSYPNPFR